MVKGEEIMTEDKFEEVMENAGETIEKGIENVANKFDKSVNRAWNHRPVRFIAKTLVFLLGAILIACSIPFFESGEQTVATLYLISGIVIIIANIAEFIIIKRK